MCALSLRREKKKKVQILGMKNKTHQSTQFWFEKPASQIHLFSQKYFIPRRVGNFHRKFYNNEDILTTFSLRFL